MLLQIPECYIRRDVIVRVAADRTRRVRKNTRIPYFALIFNFESLVPRVPCALHTWRLYNPRGLMRGFYCIGKYNLVRTERNDRQAARRPGVRS